jgi:hypothetical protein
MSGWATSCGRSRSVRFVEGRWPGRAPRTARACPNFLTQMALQSASWQWPLPIDWGGERNLKLALLGSWLACIAIPGLALSWIVLRSPPMSGSASSGSVSGFLPLARVAMVRRRRSGRTGRLAGAVDRSGSGAAHGAAEVDRRRVRRRACLHADCGFGGESPRPPGWTPDNPRRADERLRDLDGPSACLGPAAAIIFVSWLLGPPKTIVDHGRFGLKRPRPPGASGSWRG